jgi:hypothetical protein
LNSLKQNNQGATLYNLKNKHLDLKQEKLTLRLSSDLIECNFVMILLKNCSFEVKQQSCAHILMASKGYTEFYLEMTWNMFKITSTSKC